MPCPTRRTPHRLVPVAVALLVGAGCGNDVTSPAESLRVTTTVSPATFRAGDSVTVTVVVTNDGSRTHYVFAQPCDDPFQVFDGSGRAFARVPRACTLVSYAPTRTQVTLTRVWRGYVGAPSVTPGGVSDGTPLPAGEYALRGVVRATDGEGPLLVGPPVAVRIAP